MKILHITINQIEFERRILNQIRSAGEKGADASVIALTPNRNQLVKSENSYNLIPVYSPFHCGGPLKFLHFNWVVVYQALRLDITIIHCHDLWVLPSAALLKWLKRIPLVYDAHEYYRGLEIFTHRPVRRFIWSVIERMLIHRVDLLLTVSEPLANLYHEKYRLKKSVNVIRNLPCYEIPDPQRAVKLNIEVKKNVILYHGHFRPGRGLTNLIRAFSDLADFHLILIGDGELRAELLDLIKKHNLSDRVQIQDYIALDRLIATVAQADIGVVLFEATSQNYTYALPNKFFEYLMAGLPVLTSNIETLEQYVRKYNVGVTVDPADVPAITSAIKEMFTDAERLIKWRTNALAAARELNWENESGKLISLYENL